MYGDNAIGSDTVKVRPVGETHETGIWSANWTIRKYDQVKAPDALTETLEVSGNLLTYGGISNIWQSLLGNGGAGALEYFDAANAYIGVGDSNTAAAATQTDLQASTNKLRVAVDSATHTDGTSSGSANIVYVATFEAADANFAWQEIGLFNASTSGRMLNRRVQSMGTKANPAVWEVTLTLSLS